MNELVPFKVDPQADPDGARLRAFLNAQLQWERAQRLRSFFVNLLAGAGVFGVVPLVWPNAVPQELVRMGWAAWAMVAVLTLGSAFSEWRTRRERDRTLAQLRSDPPSTACHPRA